MDIRHIRTLSGRSVARGPEESPIWISLSDLMTGTAALFLVLACSVLLMWIVKSEPSGSAPHDSDVAGADAAAPTVNAAPNTSRHAARLADYDANVSTALTRISALSQQHGFSVDTATNVIDLGQAARFPLGSDRLSAEQEASLRSYVADLIALIQGDPGMALLKSITVVGYTDPAGSYLFNLDLSARRSERLMCVLLASHGEQGDASGGTVTTESMQQTVRQLFKVGGYSASAQKENAAASRRLALKLDFYKLDEPRRNASVLAMPLGSCPLGLR